MLRIRLITIFLAFTWFFAQVAEAQESLPAITHYSQTTFGVALGDKINLEVKLKENQDRIQVQWVSRDQVLCSNPRCDVDTTGWVLGKHTLILRVKNQFGSLFIPYTIYVREQRQDVNTGAVVPPLIDAKEGLADLEADDYYVLAAKGLGTFDRKERISIVDTLPKRINWSERVKAHSKSLVQFGRHNVDEHFLFAGSLARLRVGEERARIIDLLDGTIRSRQVSTDPSNFALTVAPYFQVAGDEKADLILRRSGDGNATIISLSILRGNARVLIPKKMMAEKEKVRPEDFAELLLPQGVRLSFKVNDPTAYQLTPLRHKEIANLVQQTTPWLVNLSDPGVSEKLLILPHRFVNSIETDTQVRDSVETLVRREDYVVALEKLGFAQAQSKAQPRWHYWVGVALLGLGLTEEAGKYADEAEKQNTEDFEACLLSAKIAVALKQDKKGLELYERCGSHNLSEKTDWMYDWAVAAYRSNQVRKSRELFQQVYESSESETLRREARSYLGLMKDNRPWRVQARMSYIMDNLLLGVGETDGTTLADLPQQARGIDGSLDFAGLWRFGEESYFGAGYRVEQESYFDKKLKDLTYLDQYLFFPLRMALDDTDGNLSFSVNGEVFAQTVAIGNERSLDGYGSDLHLRFHGVPFEPFVGARLAKYVDPLPERDDKLDPLWREGVLATDRSRVITAFYGGGCLVCLFVYNFDVSYRYHQEKFFAGVAKEDSMKRYALESKQRFRVGSDSEIRLLASYERENYLDNSQNRKDLVVRLGGQLALGLYGPFNFSAGGDYMRRESNVDLHFFRKTRFNLGFGFAW